MDSNNAVEMSKYLRELLNEGAEISVDGDGESKIEIPDWVDEGRVKLGQKFFHRNLSAAFFSMLLGFLTGLSIPSIMTILDYTGTSGTEYKCYKRYTQTIQHILAWFNSDLKPGTEAWKSVKMIRRFHTINNRKVINNKIGIISQKDMVLTQFGFMGFTIAKAKAIGVHDTQGLDDYVHFWRFMGHLLGIQDRFNLCADTLDETVKRLVEVNDLVIRPAIQNAGDNYYKMTKDITWGLLDLDPKPFIFFIKRLVGVPGYTYWHNESKEGKLNDNKFSKLDSMSRLVLFIIIVRLEILLQFRIFRWTLNLQQRFSNLLAYYLPYFAIFKYGVKRAYVRIFKQ